MVSIKKKNLISLCEVKIQIIDSSNPEEEYRQKEILDFVETAICSLHPREGRILELYFGFGNERMHSLNEIGERMGYTKERIRQLKDLAIEKLRKSFSDNQNFTL